MTSVFKTFKAGGRAAAVAVALGAASIVAVPAPVMAQSFNFEFPIAGGEGNFSFGIGRDGVRVRRACMTNNEIRRSLRDEDWSDIRIMGRDGNWVRVAARWDDNDRYYTMRVNRCTGKVRDIERVRRRSNGPGNGFTLEFNF